jgi:predicted DCC family thiol-disulfide oxidoreductase YuxK
MPPVTLIYDAECPVCRGSVEWVRRQASSPGAFAFLPCRSPEARERFPSVGEADCLRAVHLVLPDGTILAGEKAIPEILRRLPRWRFLAAPLSLPGAAFLSRLLYRSFAAHRYRISDAVSRSGK